MKLIPLDDLLKPLVVRIVADFPHSGTWDMVEFVERVKIAYPNCNVRTIDLDEVCELADQIRAVLKMDFKL